MALPFVTVEYTVPVKGATAAAIGAALAAVPLPLAQIYALGCYVTTDVTANGPPATRTITLRTNAPVAAAATPNTSPGASASGILSATVTAAGGGYIVPPVFYALDGAQTLSEWLGGQNAGLYGSGVKFQSYLNLGGETVILIAGGSGYSAETIAGVVGGFPLGTATATGGKPGAFLGSPGVGTRRSDPDASNPASSELANVYNVFVSDGGRGYSASSVVLFGGPQALVRPARAYPIIGPGGVVESIVVVDPGSGYIKTPTVSVFDPTGAGKGCVLTANMVRGKPAALSITFGDKNAITALTITDRGDGYVSLPQVVIWDPTGSGFGAEATVGPVVNGPGSLMQLSRVDVLNTGSAYVAPGMIEQSQFESEFLVAENAGITTQQRRVFSNLMKSAIEQALSTPVTETVT